MSISKRIAVLEAKVLPPEPNKRFQAAIRVFWDDLERDAVPDPISYCKPSIYQLAVALLERIASKTVTQYDIQMLAKLEECEYSAVTALEMMVEVTNPPRVQK